METPDTKITQSLAQPTPAEPAEPSAQSHVEDVLLVTPHFHISVRSAVALLLVVTVCVLALTGQEIKESLFSLTTGVVGFLFGSRRPKEPTR